MKSVGLVSGPTGGHLLPALLTQREFERRGYDSVLFSTAPPDHYLLDSTPGNYVPLRTGRWAGQGLWSRLTTLGSILQAFWQHREAIGELEAVVSFGGFPSVPVLLAAHEAGVPFYIHEQNRVVGRANRLFASQAQELLLGMPLPASNTTRPGFERLVGTPVRRPKLNSDAWLEDEPLLVVVAGSQGSRVLSEHLREQADNLLREGWKIYYVRGRFGVDVAAHLDTQRRSRFRQVEYQPDLPGVLSRCDVAWTRGGAGTLAELMSYGVPALVFPFSGAADDHQTLNARWLAGRGPAEVVGPDDDPADLLRITRALAREPGSYETPDVAGGDASKRIVDRVERVLR